MFISYRLHIEKNELARQTAEVETTVVFKNNSSYAQSAKKLYLALNIKLCVDGQKHTPFTAYIIFSFRSFFILQLKNKPMVIWVIYIHVLR